MSRRFPGHFPFHLGYAFMQKLHIKVADQFAVIKEPKPPVTGELTDNGRHHVLTGEESQQLGNAVRRDGQYHSLLGLGYPDFGVGQPGIFQGHFLQVNPHPGLRRHLPDRRGKTAAAAVGYPDVQPPVSGLKENINYLLLHDGVANLDRAGRNIG